MTHPFLVEEGPAPGDPVIVIGAKEVDAEHALLVWKVLNVVWDEPWMQHLTWPPPGTRKRYYNT